MVLRVTSQPNEGPVEAAVDDLRTEAG